MRRLLLVLAVLLGSPLLGHAATYTIAAPGSLCANGGACPANQFASVNALSNANGGHNTPFIAPGDTILLPDGPVPMFGDAPFYLLGIHADGSAAPPVTFKAAGTGYSYIYNSPGYGLGAGLLQFISSNVVVDHVIFDGAIGSNFAGIRASVDYANHFNRVFSPPYPELVGGVYPHPNTIVVKNSAFFFTHNAILADDCASSAIALSGEYGQTDAGQKNTFSPCSLTLDNDTFAGGGGGDGLEHGIYVDKYDQLTVTNSLFENVFAGHLLKFRGSNADIENNRFIGGDYDANGNVVNLPSIENQYKNSDINFPYGGVVVFKNNFIESGPENNNNGFIDYQPECFYPASPRYNSDNVSITGNTVVDDWSQGQLSPPVFYTAEFWRDASLDNFDGCPPLTHALNGKTANLTLTGNTFYGPYWSAAGNLSANFAYFLAIWGFTVQPAIPPGNTFDSTSPHPKPNLTPTVPWPPPEATMKTLVLTVNGTEFDDTNGTHDTSLSHPNKDFPGYFVYWNGLSLHNGPTYVTADQASGQTQTFSYQVPVVPGITNYMEFHMFNNQCCTSSGIGRTMNLLGATLNGAQPMNTGFGLWQADGDIPVQFAGGAAGPSDITAPVLATPTTLTVQQGLSKAIALSATDPDNDPASISYSVTSGPAHGTVNLLPPLVQNQPQGLGSPTTTFTQNDVNLGNVVFVSTGASGSDSFAVRVCDNAQNCVTGTQPITITVETTAPVLASPTTLTLAAGSSSPLTLSATDADNTAAQLTYTVTTPPTHGNVVKGGLTVGAFTQADVTAGLVTYQSTGTAAVSDSFVFSVSDPAGNGVTGTQSITVTAAGVPPTLVTPTTLTLQAGTTAPIALSASETGYTADQITYTVTTPPTHGFISAGGAPASSFTQAQIAAGLVSYTSTGTTAVSDSFAFTVADLAGNSTSGTQPISVILDTTAPTLAPPVTISVLIGQTKNLTTILGATDPDNSSAQISYTLLNNSTVGFFSKSGVQFTGSTATFTQADVDSRVILYIPPAIAGTETIPVVATDTAGNASGSQNWTIHVTGDTTPPTLVTPTPITLTALTSAQITLSASDTVSGPSNLTYTVTTPPTLGLVELKGAPTTTFTQSNVSNGSVAFVSTGPVGSDSFPFSVCDNAGNCVTSSQPITVTASTTAPTLPTPAPLSVLAQMPTAILLSATDVSYPSSQLIYTITAAPTKGSLIINQLPITTFTQADVDNGLVKYNSNVSFSTTDSVGLRVTDPAGNSSTVTMSVLITGSAPVVLPPNAGSLHLVPHSDGTWGWK